MVTLREGQQLGKYRVGPRLGRGGFGRVYRVYDSIEGIFVALKVPRTRYLDENALLDFFHEARVCARLDHPYILPLLNADVIEDIPVIVTPLGRGSLLDRLGQLLPVAVALRYAEQILAGLAHAHAVRVIHCDVKPENVIRFSRGRLRLADFGTARGGFGGRPGGTGTPDYMAPEQACGRPTRRSDVYSVGRVLYQMLTGHLPKRPYYVWPPPGADPNPELPEAVHDLLRRSLDPDPRRRPANASDMSSEVRSLRGALGPRSRRVVVPA